MIHKCASLWPQESAVRGWSIGRSVGILHRACSGPWAAAVNPAPCRWEQPDHAASSVSITGRRTSGAPSKTTGPEGKDKPSSPFQDSGRGSFKGSGNVCSIHKTLTLSRLQVQSEGMEHSHKVEEMLWQRQASRQLSHTDAQSSGLKPRPNK